MPLPPTGDTIAAIATAPGLGAVGVVRVSGPEAYAVADAIFRPARGAPPSRRAAGRVVFGRVLAASGEVIDEALVLTFRAPRSYTGEDVVEVQTHGGPAVLRAVLDRCRSAGARLAGPGEFTLRAFLHDRLDLVQAESVLALVQAQSDGARRHAALGLTRALSERLERVQDDVTAAYAAVQAALDYPEEGVPDAELGRPLRTALEAVDALLATADAGRLSRRGARLALLGRPNTGKSSLLNALLGFERSLVSEVPGTTRDYLEAPLDLGGVPLTAIDTAGVRSTDDAVEASGVALSRRIAAGADVVVVLWDRSRPLAPDDRALVDEVPPGRRVLVASKADLPAAWAPPEGGPEPLAVSARTGAGVAALTERIRDLLVGDAAGAEVWITEERHVEALTTVRDRLRAALSAPDDLAALELQDALRALASVTGRGDIAEETLASIFARFCVGK